MNKKTSSKRLNWLKLEGLAIMLLSIILFWKLNGSWLLFALLILSPDIAMFGYLAGKKVGATLYNLFHSYIGPALTAVVAVLLNTPILISLSLIWFAHIGMDRMLAYGLKLDSGFKDTHLGSAEPKVKKAQFRELSSQT